MPAGTEKYHMILRPQYMDIQYRIAMQQVATIALHEFCCSLSCAKHPMYMKHYCEQPSIFEHETEAADLTGRSI